MQTFWRRLQARVSVVVPLYNHARYIEVAIRSILAQGPIVKEIIVIDDGSTDNSAAVMQQLAQQDRRIVFSRQANQGAHATLNAGLQASRGELVTILNSDDAWAPGRLALLATALDADSASGLAASGLTFMDASGQTVENAWYDEALAFARTAPSLAVALVNANFLMTTSNFLLRRSMLDTVGLFAPLRYTHDLDFALRCLALGHGIVRIDKPLLRYRIHAANTIAEDHAKVRAEWALTAAAYLNAVSGQTGVPATDRADAAAMEAVLCRHDLHRAVQLCLATFGAANTTTLAESSILSNDILRKKVLACI